MKRGCLAVIGVSLVPGTLRAQQAAWDSVSRVLQATPTISVGYRQFAFPRRDLLLKVGDLSVSSRLALIATAGFSGQPNHATLVSELLVTEGELIGVVAEIDSQRLALTSVARPIPAATPKIITLHVVGHGAALDLARALDRVLARTGTPRGMAAPASAPVTIDTAAVFTALGVRGEASGNVAQVNPVFISTLVMVQRDGLSPNLVAASPIKIQDVSPQRYVATGEFALPEDRVEAITGALAAHGIPVTAIHNHLMGETPRLFYVHFWADGAPAEVLAGLKAAIDAARATP
jgi:Domain of Unknown Function (DUF1259)